MIDYWVGFCLKAAELEANKSNMDSTCAAPKIRVGFELARFKRLADYLSKGAPDSQERSKTNWCARNVETD